MNPRVPEGNILERICDTITEVILYRQVNLGREHGTLEAALFQ